MNCKSLFVVAGLAAIAGSIALAQQPAKETKPSLKPAAAQPEGMPTMTPQQIKDMQACIVAGTPGEQHKHLLKNVGTWTGTTKMWMDPKAPPVTSDCTCTISSFMENRYVKSEYSGEIPQMGMFNGFGINGFDNVSQKFVGSWVDNMSTGIMNGTGELTSDGKVLNWNFTYNCPITKKPTVMRQVETQTGLDSFTLEMFGPEPHTGVEFKMMEITLTRSASAKASE